jgi:outer membrane receptor for ferrienterochelin and colicins
MPNTHTFARQCAVFALLANTGWASAQTAPSALPAPSAPPAASAASAQRLDRQTVIGNTDAQRRASTATKIVIGRDEILKNGDASVAEALKRVPGVTIGGAPGRGGPIRMRGLGGGFTRIMLNGEPLPRGFDLDSLSPEVIERIEVLRSATAEFSSQSVAGAINIVTTGPVRREVREVNFGGAYEAGRFSPQLGFRFSAPQLASTGRLASISYAINGQLTGNRFVRDTRTLDQAFDADGLNTLARTGNGNSRENQDQLNIAPRLQANLGGGQMLSLEPFFFSQHTLSRNAGDSSTSVGPAVTFAKSSSVNDFGFTSARSNTTYVRPLGAGGGRLEASGGFNFNRFSGVFTTRGLDASGATLLNRSQVNETQSEGFSTRGKVTIPTNEKHDLAIGWEINRQTAQEQRSRREQSFSPNVQAENLDEDYSYRSNQLAFFGQDEWKVNDKLSVYTGARWEGITIDTTTSGNPQLNPSYKNKSSVLSPSMQALYKMGANNRDQLRAALSRTYRAPNPFQLSPRRFLSVNNSATSPDNQGNPGLKPELAWGLDLGYERYLDNGGFLGVNLFLRDIDDVFRNSTELINGRWLRQPINNGKARTLGLELEGKIGLQQLDKEWPRVELRANVSVYSSKVSNVPGPNNRLDAQSPATMNLGADWTVRGMPLTMGGNINVTTAGEVRTAANQITYASVKRNLDVYAQWRFNAQNTLRVSIANGLGQDQISGNTIFDPTGGFATQTSTTPTNPILRINHTLKF